MNYKTATAGVYFGDQYLGSIWLDDMPLPRPGDLVSFKTFSGYEVRTVKAMMYHQVHNQETALRVIVKEPE